MKVLLFNTAHRWIGEAAGTELLARALAGAGVEVHMAVPARGGIGGDLDREGAPYTIHDIPWRLSKKYRRPGDPNALAQYAAARRLMRDLAPDIVHAGRGKEHWLAAFLRPVAHPRAAIVRTRHVVLPMKQGAANRWLFRYGTDAVTAISDVAFRGLGTLGAHLPAERRRVILGAVDTSAYRPGRRSERLRARLGAGAEDAVLVGCLGRWQRVKGHDVFLEAMARVLQDEPQARALVAGRKVSLKNPKLEALHERTVVAAGVADRVAYRGTLADPAELIASLDIGVIASRGSEGFSRIAVEYFASGVPVIATHVGALPQMVADGETGLLVPPEDPAALAEAIGRLVCDAAQRRRLAETARAAVAETYAPERLAREMIAVYEAALAARGSSK
ncbi:MAG: glycosyltransferase family 4 protein [Sumerlaeia bacterium]